MSDLTENVANNVANEKVQDYVKKSHIIEENEQKSEKTTQDVQKNCSSLTEKWKSGKLKEGAYYVRNEHDVIFTAENYINYDCFNDTKICDFYNVETAIVEILAPVPSYEEWKFASEQLNKNGTWYTERSYKELKKEKRLLEICVNNRDNAITDLTQENIKLKELLKECREDFYSYLDSGAEAMAEAIDEVLR